MEDDVPKLLAAYDALRAEREQVQAAYDDLRALHERVSWALDQTAPVLAAVEELGRSYQAWRAAWEG